MPASAQGFPEVTYTEDFEDNDLFQPPSDDFYTYQSYSGFVAFVRDTPATNVTNQVISADTSSGDGSYGEFNLGFDMCQGGSVSWLFRQEALETDTGLTAFFMGLADKDDASRIDNADTVGVQFATRTGGANGYADNDGGVSGDFAVFSSTVTMGEWVDITISNIDCTEGQASIGSNYFGELLELDATTGWDKLDSFRFTGDSSGAAATAHADTVTYLDSFSFSGVPDIPDPLPTSSLAATANLTGAEVDRSGTTAITRHSDGNVTVWAANGLSKGPSILTNCNTSDQIAINERAVSFLQCATLGGNDVDTLSIRDHSLQTPDWPEDCDTWSDGCQQDIDAADISENQAEAREIAGMKAFPFDFTTYTDSAFTDYVPMAWAFSEQTTGNVGIFTYMQRAGASDTSDSDSRTLDASGSPQVDQICTMRSGGVNYLVAGSINVATKVYRATFEIDTLAGAPFALLVDLTAGATLPVSNAVSISCAPETGTVFITRSNGEAAIYDVGGAQLVDLGDVANGNSRGGVISEDGKFGAFLSDGGTQVTIFDASNGTFTGLVDMPEGTFQSMHMDATAQNLWIFTDTNSTVTNIVASTTVTPVGIPDPDVGDGGGGAGGAGAGTSTIGFTDGRTAAADAFGTTETIAALFFAVIVMVAMAVWLSKEFGSVRVGAPVGAGGGLVMSLALGFIGLPLLFGFVLLATGFTLFRFHQSRGE